MAGRQLHRLSALRVAKEVLPGHYADGGGLYMQIADSGTRSWVFRFKLDGRVRERLCRAKDDATISQLRRRGLLTSRENGMFASSRCNAIVTHLSLAGHVRDLYAGQDETRAPEILEPHHRFDDAFDGPVILLDDVVQVFVLPHLDRR